MYQSGAPTWWHSRLNYQCLNISISTGTFCYIGKKNPILLWERSCLYSISVDVYLFSASIRTVQKWNCWYIFKMAYIQASGTLYTTLWKQSFKTYARQPTLIKNFFCNKVVNSAEKLFPASLHCIPPNIVLHLSPVNAMHSWNKLFFSSVSLTYKQKVSEISSEWFVIWIILTANHHSSNQNTELLYEIVSLIRNFITV